jgi:hypothetical protein
MPTEIIEGLSQPMLVADTEGLVTELPAFEQRAIGEPPPGTEAQPEEPVQEEKLFRISAHGQKVVDLIERYIPLYERETGCHSLPWDQLDIQTKALIASGFVMGLTMSYGTLRSLIEHPENIDFKRVTPEGGDYDGGEPSG